MTNATRRTQIEIETHEVKIIRLHTKPVLARCNCCRGIITALTPRQTAEILEISEKAVFRLIEAERVHSANSKRGFTLICANSFGDENEVVTRNALSTIPNKE